MFVSFKMANDGFALYFSIISHNIIYINLTVLQNSIGIYL